MTLQMLWEQDEPDGVLRDRFGLADLDAASAWVSGMLERHWGIAVAACDRIVMSDRNALAWVRSAAGEHLLLKWSVAPERFARLGSVAALAAWLGARGLPVSAPVPARDGRVQVEDDGVSAGLQRVVSGTWLDVDDLRQVRSAGSALARLHAAMRSWPERAHVEATLGRPASASSQIAAWIAADPTALTPHSRTVLKDLLDAAPPEPDERQVVHGDFRAANVLMAGDEVTGVLDLEEIRVDSTVGELARSAVLLGTMFREWAPVSTAVHGALLEGYQTVRGLTEAELAWWRIQVLWYALALVPPGDDPHGWGAAADELVAAEPRPGTR